MDKMTITEALAEVKLVEKKVAKKKENLLANISRIEHVPDPYEKHGGLQVAMRSELQAIGDLDNRLVNIRGAIAKANSETMLTVGEETKSIGNWITWKREIAEKRIEMLRSIATSIKSKADHESRNPTVYKTETGEVKICKVIFALDYSDIQAQYERLGDKLERIDGLLSLKNATTVVEF